MIQAPDKLTSMINESRYISRDLSWLQFNYRVLDQAKHIDRTLLERLKFIAITASNLDEFFMIRVGSLYNYMDFNKERIDYSGLRELPFRRKLLGDAKEFVHQQNQYFVESLKPLLDHESFTIGGFQKLSEDSRKLVNKYFRKTVYPMLTPMAYDSYHTFPILMNNRLIFGVVTKGLKDKDKKKNRKVSFIQIPKNLPRFFEIDQDGQHFFIPIEELIRENIDSLFKNVDILSINLFRITRNGDFTLEESDDIEANFLAELKQKLRTRKTGRVVRVEVYNEMDPWLKKLLDERWELDDYNHFVVPPESLIDLTCLWQIHNSPKLRNLLPPLPKPVQPVGAEITQETDLFRLLKEKDVLLHHPYNSIQPLIYLLEQAAEDPDVLSIKITIYRLAKDSRVTAALKKAAEKGKHVSVLFEVKARFDEENNLREAETMQKAGCYVIYGISSLKTHTKLLLVVRKEDEQVRRYVHMSSGNYNESTAKLYTDIGFLTSDDDYAQDVSEFFNVITGHSQPDPDEYTNLITAPDEMRKKLVELIRTEAENARAGLSSGIIIKINSLQDKEMIDELYLASQSGVPIKMIIRGMCCLRPGREGLSENIKIYSIVGDFLEHSRLYYFHNNDDPKIYCGSADSMVRSFDRRMESLFLIKDHDLRQQAIKILEYNLRDNVNTYEMIEDGSYVPKQLDGQPAFNIHKEFFNMENDWDVESDLFN